MWHLHPTATNVAPPPACHGGGTFISLLWMWSPRPPPWTCHPYPKSQPTPGSVPEQYYVPRGAGTGGLGLAIEGPSEAKMSCKDNKDGSCTVEYIPFTPGDYDVNITFGGHPIPGAWWGWGLGGGRGQLGGCATHQGGCGWRWVPGCWQVEVFVLTPCPTPQ